MRYVRFNQNFATPPMKEANPKVSEGTIPTSRKFGYEKGSQKSSNPSKDDLELIDIESLFDEDTDDRPVLSQEEAWELFA